MNHVELETPRLLLRPPVPEDFPRYASFSADPVTMEHLGGPQQEADAWRGFACLFGYWCLTPASMFSVVEKSSGVWVGRVGPLTPHQWPVQEVGWGLHRDAEGRGYAVEAAVASIDYVFDILGWERVDHLIADANTRSRVLAERLGSTAGGEVGLPGSRSDVRVRVWGQTREAWRENRAAFDGLVPRTR
jgi:RimJ/RimL family protein N-acetyltransferase